MEQRFFTLDELSNLPQPQWLIEGMFEAKSLVMLAGPSYSFKSFLLLDWLLTMASGRDWNGHKTVPCKVAYMLGEGKSGLLKRAQAWIKYHQLTSDEMGLVNDRFRVSFEVPQLAAKSSTDNMLADLNKFNFKPDVIAIDTFARSMVGLDENEAKDTGLWVEQADRLRQLGYTVIFLHHTKKNTEFGVQYRGSTAIMGAMDTAMTLLRQDQYTTLTITKQKDHDEGAPMRFRRVLVPLGSDESCVLVPAPIIDERFGPGGDNEVYGASSKRTEEHEVDPSGVDKVINELMKSAESQRAKARKLAELTGISEAAALSRIHRLGGSN